MFKASSWRFVIITFFGLSNFTNAFLWICFSPIVDATMQRYDVSNMTVNYLSLVFLFLYLPGSILGVAFMERYGLRVSLITGAVLNALCAWIRYSSSFVADPHAAFGVLMLGQSLGALAQPIFTNLPSRIGGDWFPTSERDVATVIAALSNPLGNAAGSVVPSVIVNGPDDIPALLLYQGIWCTAIAVLVIIFVRDRPPTPPSAAAATKWKLQGVLFDVPHHHHHHHAHAISGATVGSVVPAVIGKGVSSSNLAPLLEHDSHPQAGMPTSTGVEVVPSIGGGVLIGARSHRNPSIGVPSVAGTAGSVYGYPDHPHVHAHGRSDAGTALAASINGAPHDGYRVGTDNRTGVGSIAYTGIGIDDHTIGGTASVGVTGTSSSDLARAALVRLRHDFALLLRNRNFLLLMTAFGIGLGIFNALMTLLAQIIQPCGYGSDTAGYAGGALLGAGLLAAVVVGIVLEKTHAYVPLLRLGILASVGTTLFFLGSLKISAEGQLIAACAAMGASLIPLLPISLENAAECTYPVPEDNSASLLLLMGNLWGIVFIFALTPMIDLSPSSDCSSIASPLALLIALSLAVAAVVLLLFRKDYRRQKAEAENRDGGSDDDGDNNRDRAASSSSSAMRPSQPATASGAIVGGGDLAVVPVADVVDAAYSAVAAATAGSSEGGRGGSGGGMIGRQTRVSGVTASSFDVGRR